MAIELYLVRHGETLFNQQHRMQGSSDSPLTERGKKQALAVRDYFAQHSLEFDHAYCSTQERTSDTLEIILGQGVPYKRLKNLKERNYGFAEGRGLWWYPIAKLLQPPMESRQAATARIKRAMMTIQRDAQDGERILIVGHGDTLSSYIRATCQDARFFDFNNCGVAKLTSDGQKVTFDSYVWPGKKI